LAAEAHKARRRRKSKVKRRRGAMAACLLEKCGLLGGLALVGLVLCWKMDRDKGGEENE